jgi:type I restriction enzyme M protein
MLDRVTKKRIDDLRNILVGKTPSPQSQVEQITTGLIYKFMYDMDTEAVEMGGVPSFFVGDYEKYSWKHLFNPKLGGADKVQLYSDAIENMYTNPTAPPLFKEIFKNSYLPFKDAKILNMFLKEINEFNYSDSEILGDAYEYLVSFLGSQGEAGQFRTPRHIIDFIVEIVNPQKNETILDPACGTGGFLISYYKHILTQNTEERLGDKLNASERRILSDNLVGYDIDPTFIKISLVNLHLHKFTNHQIHEYDTLSSDDRWNEYFDLIVANPPFMTPKGGVQPHSRFGVQSKKAEVLFVDYIMEHLKPNGRAGIVVPEGIIFQNGGAYKKLRKKLVNESLVGVISLPMGVFKPYSGVKTSILILDKNLYRRKENIFFTQVLNDGYSLGDKRTPIKENDLPKVLDDFKRFSENDDFDCGVVKKNTILQERDTSLSIGRYINESEHNSIYPMVDLGSLITLEYGKPLKKENRTGKGNPVYGSNGVVGFHNEYLVEGPCIIVGRKGSAGAVTYSSRNAFPIDTTFFVKLKNDSVNLKYVFYTLKKLPLDTLNIQSGVPGLNRNDAYDLKVPLPPMEVQEKIVGELDRYQTQIETKEREIKDFNNQIKRRFGEVWGE